ncbi:hypothetical protein C7212DRAFT_363900 [Tuber magnatum]|uniref:Uncharacterized protein n=1 Tax=Tuber magnatum TaxID=42249 RepID=A0A317SNJ8_9PEZI|nr:hypothetical protein C7212DRAFT_363900 [Tuber magnatum]
MSFWDNMELWEKMCLLLAIGMVLVLSAGASKMVYTKLRVKRYAKKAEARRSHLANMRESRHVIDLKSDEVPFGIRAIEAGIEVEGVVISRPATPTRASYNPSQVTLVASDADSMKSRGQCPPSPRSTQGFYGTPPPMKQMARGGPMVYQPSPYLSMPSPVHQGHSAASSIRSSASSVASTATPTPPLTRVSSVEKLGRGSFPEGVDGGYFDGTRGTPTGATTIPDTLARLEGRTISPALEHHRNTGSRHYRTHSRTPSPPEGPGSPTLPSVDENEISEGSSRASDSSVEGMTGATRPRLISTYSTPILPTMRRVSQPLPEGVQGDLSLLHEHRLSHAAEVGQLLPRRRDILRNSQIAGSPVTESPSSYYSPITSDRVYALDIAMPPAMSGVDGLQFPAPAVTVGSPTRLELTRLSSDPASGEDDLPMFDGPWLSKSGGNGDKGGSTPPKTSDQSGSTTPKSKVPADFSSSDSDPPKQKSKKLQKKNRRSRGSPSRNSATDVDLEAQ